MSAFNGIRQSAITLGDTVAIQGLGGLGHLAVQYARQMGYRTIAISRQESKRALAHQLGAHIFINSTDAAAEDTNVHTSVRYESCSSAGSHAAVNNGVHEHGVATALSAAGGADLIILTAPTTMHINALLGGLNPRGRLLVLAEMGAVCVDAATLVRRALSVAGWQGGHALDGQEAVGFSQLHGVRCVVQRYRLDDADKALDDVKHGRVRFRAVLIP